MWQQITLRAFLVAFALGMATPAVAGKWIVTEKICLRDLIDIRAFFIELGPIPIGCEVIDCCPGCPGPGYIDLRVRVAGSKVASVSLSFENLNLATRKNLKLKGRGRWTPKGELRLDDREVTVTGFVWDRRGRPPVVIPKINFDPVYLKKLAARRQQDKGTRQVKLERVELAIEQYVGKVIVNKSIFHYWVYYCPRRPVTDRIKLKNNTGNDDAVVYLDARRSTGCVNDEEIRVDDIVGVGNVLSNNTCYSEAIVLSDDDAVEVVNPTLWTNLLGDLLPVTLRARWPANVAVWIAMPQAQRANALAQAQNEMGLADGFYNTNHCGIDLLQTAQYTTVTNQNTINTITNAAANIWNTFSCAQVGNIQGSGSFTAGQLNVYYVNSAFTGWFCPGSNVIAIGTNAQPGSLAHEFGHSFSVGHTNNVDYDGDGANDFGNNNIMWAGGNGRTHFSEAQCFRTNVNTNSSINTNGERTTGSTRNCPDATISAQCPWLGLDATPN